MMIRVLGNNTRVLVIDPETGLVMDLIYGADICGSYFYKSQQTELACDFGNSLLNNTEAINRAVETGEDVVTDWGQDDMGDAVLGLGSSIAISVGVAALLCCGPVGWVALAAGAGLVALGVAGSYYAADLDEGWTTSR